MTLFPSVVDALCSWAFTQCCQARDSEAEARRVGGETQRKPRSLCITHNPARPVWNPRQSGTYDSCCCDVMILCNSVFYCVLFLFLDAQQGAQDCKEGADSAQSRRSQGWEWSSRVRPQTQALAVWQAQTGQDSTQIDVTSRLLLQIVSLPRISNPFYWHL